MSALATARSSRADVGPCSATAAISSETSSIWTFMPRGVLPEPAQARIRGRPAERLLRQPRHRPVVDHLAVLVAPRRVVDLPDRHLRHVARDQPIHQPRRVGPRHHVLEERRHVDQRGGVADGVVFVLVMALVGADGVIPGPLAIVQALAQRRTCARGTGVPIGMLALLASHYNGNLHGFHGPCRPPPRAAAREPDPLRGFVVTPASGFQLFGFRLSVRLRASVWHDLTTTSSSSAAATTAW